MSEMLCAVLLATLSMQEAVTHAIAHSPEIRVLEAQLVQARATATIADAFRPTASVSTTPGYATGLPVAALGQVPAIATVEAHKILYDASARADQIGAQSDVDAAESRLESRKREVAGNTAELYARVAADGALATSAQHRVDAYQTIASHADALRGEGRARDVDVNRAALQLATAKRAALQAQSRLELDQLRLERLTGEQFTVTLSEAKGLIHRDPSLTLRMTEENDPELRSLDKRIAAAQTVLASEDRLFKPTIFAQIQYSRLFDRYGRYYLNFRPDDFSAAASLTLPIWTSGRRSAAIARVNGQLQELIALREARHTELELTLREAETDLQQAAAEQNLAEETLVVARQGLQIAEELEKEGRGEVNDLPLAQIAVADAEDAKTIADSHLTAARARLLIVCGDLI
jgi:outer membrane protein TolC